MPQHTLAVLGVVAADRAANSWPLAVISFGASWHNSHHADPACARHGVLPGQLDPAARLIWLLETPAGSTTCTGPSRNGSRRCLP